MRANNIDFEMVNYRALRQLPSLLHHFLPGGAMLGHEYLARNPVRDDRRAGSFKINMLTGRWSDFAIAKSGGDVISLVAYLHGSSQLDAARKVLEVMEGSHGR